MCSFTVKVDNVTCDLWTNVCGQPNIHLIPETMGINMLLLSASGFRLSTWLQGFVLTQPQEH